MSDLEGGPADETVRFGLDGLNYEIDLSTDEAAALRGALNPYMKAGRMVAAAASRAVKSRSAAAPPRRNENRKIRDWAKVKGFHVSGRGRISADVVDAYRKAVTKPGKPAECLWTPVFRPFTGFYGLRIPCNRSVPQGCHVKTQRLLPLRVA